MNPLWIDIGISLAGSTVIALLGVLLKLAWRSDPDSMKRDLPSIDRRAPKIKRRVPKGGYQPNPVHQKPIGKPPSSGSGVKPAAQKKVGLELLLQTQIKSNMHKYQRELQALSAQMAGFAKLTRPPSTDINWDKALATDQKGEVFPSSTGKKPTGRLQAIRKDDQPAVERFLGGLDC